MITYKPLLIQLINRNMTKTQLKDAIGLSPSTLAKLAKNEYVSLEVIERICEYLNCQPGDIISFEYPTKS